MSNREINDAYEVLERNYKCMENSMSYDLHEKSIFSETHFWEFYDSVIALAKEAQAREADTQTAMEITFVYQHFLKEIIYHFDKQDESCLKHFPKNYLAYIERLDGALDAYFRGVFMDEELYSLKR